MYILRYQTTLCCSMLEAESLEQEGHGNEEYAKTRRFDTAGKEVSRADSTQLRQESVKSNAGSTPQKQDFVKFINAQNYCSYCQKNGHGKDICWKVHPELRHSREPKELEQKEDVVKERKDNRDTPPTRDGSPNWNWADFMPFM